ncbi:MAG: WecB/TagA/CpsF family glycosyltransferase [Lachnospiraceae bacterium]|nr:WecB/TagA/CpsF family glycosyltransferase [Lachnospiraceae bacterium]MBR1851661.1 WecB/TagA/CpsF family glycosyltransferase [Lachnospiraceae bacterium]
MPKNRYKILNTYVNAISMDETIAEVEKIIDARKPTQHVVINALKVNLMREDPELRKIVNSCPLINADGASIVWAAKKLGVPLKERVAGIDLFENLVKVAAEKGYKIYLFGAKEEVVTKVKDIFEKQYPKLQIVGYRNGYFTEDDEPQIVADMAASGADMMFVAFSSPKKEYWVNKYINQLNIPFVMGVGGSFDVVAGVTDRAPKWMQNHGMEWFYRFIQEPKRLWNRYMVGNRKFVQYTYRYRRAMKKKAKSVAR